MGEVVDSQVNARERCCCEVHRECDGRARCMDLREGGKYLDLGLLSHLISVEVVDLLNLVGDCRLVRIGVRHSFDPQRHGTGCDDGCVGGLDVIEGVHAQELV